MTHLFYFFNGNCLRNNSHLYFVLEDLSQAITKTSVEGDVFGCTLLFPWNAKHFFNNKIMKDCKIQCFDLLRKMPAHGSKNFRLKSDFEGTVFYQNSKGPFLSFNDFIQGVGIFYFTNNEILVELLNDFIDSKILKIFYQAVRGQYSQVAGFGVGQVHQMKIVPLLAGMIRIGSLAIL